MTSPEWRQVTISADPDPTDPLGKPRETRARDAAGRPRNDRPRDGLGRPLPRQAVEESVERIPDDLVLPPGESLAEAQRLLDAGRPFHAHEILEGRWRVAPAPERDLWQGLAQLAVGITHVARGNPRGAVTLLRRGAVRLARYRDDPPHGVAVEGLVAWADACATEIEADLGREGAAAPGLTGEPARAYGPPRLRTQG